MKKGIALVLLGTMLLSGCGGQTEETTLPPTVPVTTAAPTTEPPTAAPTEAPTEVPTEPVFYNPLNGQPMAEESDLRPVAVMINNSSAALPQCGLSEADIIYEILAEGDITRLMAIFSDAHEAGPVGPVRSLRPYYLDIMRGYDAICTSAGGSDQADHMIYQLGYPRLNGIGGAGDRYFYRDQWRKNNRGYEHSLFVKGEDLYKGAQEADFRMTVEENKDFGLHFDEDALVGGEEIRDLTVYFLPGRSTKLHYDEDLGGYTAFQHGTDMIDGNNNEKLVFRNVLVLRTDSGVIDGVGHRRFTTTGEGQGHFFWDGKHIPITWKRDEVTDAFQYLDHAGNPISMGVGKTYIAVVDNSATVELYP